MKEHFAPTQIQFEVTNLTNCCNVTLKEGNDEERKKVKKIRGTERKS